MSLSLDGESYVLSMHGEQFAQVLTDGEAADARIVSIKKARELLGDITYRQVLKMIKAGTLRSMKLGRRRMILKKSIDEYIDARLAEAEQLAS